MARKKNTTLPNFEKSLKELEEIVERMEQGEISLEESLQLFERGINLTRICQQSLQLAEQKVQQLIEKNGEEQIVPFDDEATRD